MKPLEVVKTGIGVVISLGVGAIVGNAIKSTTPVDIKKTTKICITLASFVLTSLAGDMAAKYTEEKIDEAVDMVNEAIKDSDPKDEEDTKET